MIHPCVGTLWLLSTSPDLSGSHISIWNGIMGKLRLYGSGYIYSSQQNGLHSVPEGFP